MGMSTAGEGTRDKSHFIAIAVRGKSDKIAQTRQDISQVSRDLPPLNALRAFEVAARLESISRPADRSEEHTSELQVTNAPTVCRLLVEKKKKQHTTTTRW